MEDEQNKPDKEDEQDLQYYGGFNTLFTKKNKDHQWQDYSFQRIITSSQNSFKYSYSLQTTLDSFYTYTE